jgi:methylase of polypeptide subunit release factors
LEIIRRLVAEAVPALGRDGLLFFEFGAGQDCAVEEVIERTHGLELVEIKPDLQDIPRVAVSRKI